MAFYNSVFCAFPGAWKGRGGGGGRRGNKLNFLAFSKRAALLPPRTGDLGGSSEPPGTEAHALSSRPGKEITRLPRPQPVPPHPPAKPSLEPRSLSRQTIRPSRGRRASSSCTPAPPPRTAHPNTHPQGGRLPGPETAHRPGRPGAPARGQRRTRGWAGPGLRLPGRRRAGAADAAKPGRALRGWGRRRTLRARVVGSRTGGASCSTSSSCSGGGGGGCLGEINKSGLSFGSALAAILSRTSERRESGTEEGRRHLRVAGVRAI